MEEITTSSLTLRLLALEITVEKLIKQLKENNININIEENLLDILDKNRSLLKFKLRELFPEMEEDKFNEIFKSL